MAPVHTCLLRNLVGKYNCSQCQQLARSWSEFPLRCHGGYSRLHCKSGIGTFCLRSQLDIRKCRGLDGYQMPLPDCYNPRLGTVPFRILIRSILGNTCTHILAGCPRLLRGQCSRLCRYRSPIHTCHQSIHCHHHTQCSCSCMACPNLPRQACCRWRSHEQSNLLHRYRSPTGT
jgi:hypothetical protein